MTEKLLILSSSYDILRHFSDEKSTIEEVLKEDRKRIKLDEKNGITYESLERYFTEEEGQIVTMVHYVGHSTEDGLSIKYKDQQGEINVTSITNLLTLTKNVWFVFLNSCYSKSLAEALIEGGISYVIGTTNSVSDQIAIKVAEEFYKKLTIEDVTIEKAYELTCGTIEGLEFQKYLKEVRGALVVDDDDQFQWQLYPEDKRGILEGRKKWVLRRKIKPELPQDKNKKKLKVACVYHQDYQPYFEAVKNNIIDERWIMASACDKDGDVMVKELSAADVLLHFVDSSNYKNKIDTLLDSYDKEKFMKKWHVCLPLKGELDEIVNIQNEEWFKVSEQLKLYKPLFDLYNNLINKDLNELINVSLKDKLEDVFRSLIEINFVNTDYVKRDLRVIPFIKEQAAFKGNPNSPYYFVYINGSNDCAQALLVNKLRNIASIESGTKKILIKFNSSTEQPLNLFENEKDFWKYFLGEELLDNDLRKFNETLKQYEGVYDKSAKGYMNICADLIRKSIKNEHKLIILDHITDSQLNKFQFVEFKKSLEEIFKAEIPPKYKVWIFFVNYNLNRPISIADENLDYGCHITVKPLPEEDFNKWYNDENLKIKSYAWFRQIEKTSIIEQFRKCAMLQICNSLKIEQDDCYQIIEKVLSYD